MITGLDHLLIGVPDLEAGIDWWAEQSGVRPIHGGVHEGMGTRNALVALGETLYLELLAPDPRQTGGSPVRAALEEIDRPTPFGWCYACDDAKATRDELTARDVESALVPMSRETPEGEQIAWELIFPSHSLGPVIPFLIDWSSATRPAATAPRGCRLLEVLPIHPEPAEAQTLLDRMGIEATVTDAPRSSLRFRFETPHGELCVEP